MHEARGSGTLADLGMRPGPCLCAAADRAAAQLDPLLVIKSSVQAPSGAARALVIVALDLSPRMQSDGAGHYYDPADYAPDGVTDTALGLSPARLASRYRRRYDSLQAAGGADKYITLHDHNCWRSRRCPLHQFLSRGRASAWLVRRWRESCGITRLRFASAW